MGSIIVDSLTLPIPGRVLQPEDEKEYPQCTNVQLSIGQALRSRTSAKSQEDLCRGTAEALVGEKDSNGAEKGNEAEQIRRGKDLIWTSDIDIELPIKLADSGPAALPPVTLVEYFADVVRRCGDLPAMLFEPHFPPSCGDGSTEQLSEEDATAYEGVSSNTASKGSRSAQQEDDGGTQRVCFLKNGNSHCPPCYQAELLPGWAGYTWKGYWNEVCYFAKSLLYLEAPTHARVAIMGCNAAAWAVAFFGTVFAGGIAVGVYTTNNVEACKYVVSHSQCQVAVVDTLENMRKMLAVRRLQQQEREERLRASKDFFLLPGGCEVLQLIVVYRDPVPPALESEGVMSLEDFLHLGRGVLDSRLSARMEAQKPGQCCNIVYTSGTTGFPKGVMLSHDNLTWTACCMSQVVHLEAADRLISMLPLSHVAAQVVDLIAPLINGTRVYFARPDALRGTLLQSLLKVRPTWFLAVPRIWEKIEHRLKEFGAKARGLRRRASVAAKDVGYRGTVALLEGKSPPLGFRFVNRCLLHQVRKALGLDQCNAFGSCAAPINPDTQKYFMSLGIPINSLFGLSESSGPQTFVAPAPGWFKVGSIGHTLPGTDMYIDQPDASGSGEICFRGRNIFMGYLNDPRATMEAIDARGFLHTGDVGRVDSQGFIFLTGRSKELLITAGGENVPPVYLEDLIRQELPFVSNCMVVGDRRPYLSVLLCLSSEKDDHDGPTDRLAPDSMRAARNVNSQVSTTTQAMEDPALNKLIQQGLERVNAKAVSRAQRIVGWRIIPVDFSVGGGELTATLKLRRKVVLERYEKVVEDMYKDAVPKCLRASTSRL